MKKFILVNVITISLITIFALSGCVSGIASKDDYNSLFSGITAEYDSGNYIFYPIDILLDENEFDSIQSKPYTSLEINIKDQVLIQGIVFTIKSEKPCSLIFRLSFDEQDILHYSKSFQANVTSDVELFLSNEITLYPTSSLVIEIDENTNAENLEKTSFKFDNFLIFLKE